MGRGKVFLALATLIEARQRFTIFKNFSRFVPSRPTPSNAIETPLTVKPGKPGRR